MNFVADIIFSPVSYKTDSPIGLCFVIGYSEVSVHDCGL